MVVLLQHTSQLAVSHSSSLMNLLVLRCFIIIHILFLLLSVKLVFKGGLATTRCCYTVSGRLFHSVIVPNENEFMHMKSLLIIITSKNNHPPDGIT